MCQIHTVLYVQNGLVHSYNNSICLHLRRSSRWLQRISPLGTFWRNSSWLNPQRSRPGMWILPISISSMLNSFITHTAQWITWSALQSTGSLWGERSSIRYHTCLISTTVRGSSFLIVMYLIKVFLTIWYAKANLLLAVAFKCCGPACDLLWRLIRQARSVHGNEMTLLHQSSLLSCCIWINHHLYCFYRLHYFQNVQLLLPWTWGKNTNWWSWWANSGFWLKQQYLLV